MNYTLITGVSTGIGYAAAKQFLEKEHIVFGSVRKQADAERLQKEFGENFIPLLFDVVEDEAIAKAKTKVEGIVGEQGLSCLVNNAGIAVQGPVAHLPIEKWQYQLDVNVIGVVRVTQVFLPLLGFGAGNTLPKGKIINISSGAGRATRPFLGAYAASKHALEAISDALRRELMPFGIEVVVIEPGPIQTPIWAKAKATPNYFKETEYGDVFEHQRHTIEEYEKRAIPVKKVAQLIYKTYAVKRPRTRYLIAPQQWILWLAIHVLPDRLVDKLMYREYKRYMK